MTIRHRISPPPPPTASYEVVIQAGALADLPSLLREAAPAHRYVMVTDSNVAPLWGEGVLRSLRDAGLAADPIVVPAGEVAKTRETWGDVLDAMVSLGLGRDSCVVAVGGGVVGDLAGFAAATFLRGVPVVQVPTSLLAMVDAAVGGKTAIDLQGGKNLAGAFHHPRLVLADPGTLATLPDDELRSGLAEVVKHGAIADATYVEAVVAARDAIFGRAADVLAGIVARSVQVKARFAADDPYERGPRKALNAGHTIGHALEALSGFEMLHGHAVAMGLIAESRAGELAGLTSPGTASRLESVFATLGLPTRVPYGIGAAEILEAARSDKKARAARLHYALVADLGRMARGAAGEWTLELDDAVVTRALALCGAS